MLDQVQFTLIHGPNIPGSYAILFFAASDFAFITRHIHSWASFLLWSGHIILSGSTSSSPPLFPSSVLDTFWPGGLIFQCHIFLSFYMRFSLQVYWGVLLCPPVVLGDTTLIAESEEELKSLLMRVKNESEKTGLELNIQKLRSWHLFPSLYGK